MRPAPLVSIVTPVYNAERYLEECLQSVRAQTFERWEHVLADDGSTDDSVELLKHASAVDHRVRFTTMAANSGPAQARNVALEMAEGRFIAFLDSDDLWLPEKLDTQVSFMIGSGRPFTFTSYREVDETGVPTGVVHRAKPEVDYRTAMRKNPIGCLTAMYDTDFYGKVPMPNLRKRHDFGLWLDLLLESNAYGLPDCLASYRVRPNSVSSDKFELMRHEWNVYRHHVGLGPIASSGYLASAVLAGMAKVARRAVTTRRHHHSR